MEFDAINEDARDDFCLIVLSDWSNDTVIRQRAYDLADAMIKATRQPDMYEPDTTTIWHLGCSGSGRQVRIVWHGFYWWIDNFLALVLACEKRRLDMEQLKRDLHDDEIAVNRDAEAQLETLQDADEHMLCMDAYTDSERDEILRAIFFLAMNVDTRCMRVFCKYNNLLEAYRIEPPRIVTVNAMQRELGGIVDAYLIGAYSADEFLSALRMLCSVGHTRGVPRHPSGTHSATNFLCFEPQPDEVVTCRTIRVAIRQ